MKVFFSFSFGSLSYAWEVRFVFDAVSSPLGICGLVRAEHSWSHPPRVVDETKRLAVRLYAAALIY